jgi:polyhydroxyalkanoate synthase
MKSLPILSFPADQLAKLQADYAEEMKQLWQQGMQSNPVLKDRRFAAEAWQHNPVSAFTAAMYLLNARTLLSMSDMVDTDEKTRARIKFSIEQWIAASSPSNFLAFNAEAQQKAIDTKGESIVQGLQNMLHDMQQGHVSMTDQSKFEVGKNVATSEGAVVFENEIFQLIEYKPLTPKVYQRPFLLVPPCINKFYILDLQPANSFIRHVVEQGHRTFVVSWRNPDASMNHTHWDDYVEKGVMQAIEVVRQISNMPQINALGFCVGGTLLTSALSVVSVNAEIENSAPVANAGLNQTARISLFYNYATVTLDGTGSTDANSDSLTYKWTLTTLPTGSKSALSSTTSAKPTFNADQPGIYIATLVVNDGKVDSNLSSVSIQVN